MESLSSVLSHQCDFISLVMLFLKGSGALERVTDAIRLSGKSLRGDTEDRLTEEDWILSLSGGKIPQEASGIKGNS